MKRNIYKYTYLYKNHINKCIYEKELEWNGIVNNKAWSRVLNKKRCVF